MVEKVKYKNFEDAVMKSAVINIIVYVCLLLSTILASGFFGIPRYLVTPFEKSSFFTNVDNWHWFFVIIFKIFSFFFAAIYGCFSFFGYYILYSLNAFRDSSKLEDLKKITITKEWEYESAKNLISMIVFSMWCILLARSIVKLNLIEDVIEEENKEETKN